MHNYKDYLPVLFLLATIVFICDAHIRLTFPPARYPSLDFLDNARTEAPCGVPRPRPGRGIRTTLVSGSKVPVTWDMAYPHQGGFTVELLDENDRLIMYLTPNFTGSEDPTQESELVQLPTGFKCKNCVLKLTRQALEWGNAYRFWSCADVDITDEPTSATCSRRGKLENGLCQCRSPFHGKKCQFYNECEVDIDCGLQGKCMDRNTLNYPRKVCYCRVGYFGERCRKISNIQHAVPNYGDGTFKEKSLGSSGDTMHWRILKDSAELEMILTFNSSTWVSIGWKPKEKYLLDFSFLRLDKRFPAPGSGSASAEPEPEPEGTPIQFNDQNTQPEPEPEPEGNDGSHHPMDGADLVIGSAKGNYHRIADYYTISRATPEKDEFYGGKQSLTDAAGFEKNGYTIIMFRKKLSGGDVADHDITDQPMMVLWAKGQTAGNYKHYPDSGLESSRKTRSDFYQPDVIKYHGIENRGHTTVNFFDENDDSSLSSNKQKDPNIVCTGQFSYPEGCVDKSCDYKAEWLADDSGVQFTVMAKITTSRWTGIGFSKQGIMRDADIIMGSITGNGFINLGDFTSTGYLRPQLDKQQDIFDVSSSFDDGVAKFGFKRAYSSLDTEDSSLEQCLYFLYPTSGGPLRGGQIGRHFRTPMVSQTRICLAKCRTNNANIGLGSGGSSSNSNNNVVPSLPTLPRPSSGTRPVRPEPLGLIPFLPILPLRGRENKVPNVSAGSQNKVPLPDPVVTSKPRIQSTRSTTEDWRSKYQDYVDECLTNGSRVRTHWSGFTVGDCSKSEAQLRRCQKQCMIWLPGLNFGDVITKECRIAQNEFRYRCFCQYSKPQDENCIQQQ